MPIGCRKQPVAALAGKAQVGAPSGITMWPRPAFVAEAAELAHQRSKAFLDKVSA